tara:strand:- start:432 stop:716 length:285 start_codon:yes stop_codon:yes gene_type:complete
MNWFEEIIESGFGSAELDSLLEDERKKLPNLDKEIEARKADLRAKGDTTFTDDDALWFDVASDDLFQGVSGRDRDKLIDVVARYQMQKEGEDEE